MIFTIGLSMLFAGVMGIMFLPVSAFERLNAQYMPNWKALSLFIAWVTSACGCFLMLISMGILAVRYLP